MTRDRLQHRALIDRLNNHLTELNSQLDTIVAQRQQVQTTKTLEDYELNDSQKEAVNLALAGESFVLTGAAGTGKTLTVNSIARAKLSTNRDYNPQPLPMVSFRDPKGGINDQEAKPAIAFVAFTNRAVNNMAGNLRKLSPDLMDELYSNFMTIHKLLEVAPEYYFDMEANKDKMRFVPRRDALNRLPIRTLIIEEASMVDLSLWDKLFSALEPGCQIILLGDLNQLPPVFGDSILNYGLIKLPVIELTHVYRQALDSPIIRQMHRVLNGHTPTDDTEDFQVDTGASNKPVGAERMGRAVANVMNKLHTTGKYDPMEDIILTPFNKAGCGTIIINKLVSSWLDDKCRAEGSPRTVYEIISGLMKHYFAVGDLVYDASSKMQGVISKIHINGNYYGVSPQEPSTELTRFGWSNSNANEGNDSDLLTMAEFDYSTLDVNNLGGKEVLTGDMAEAEKKILASSHVVTVLLEDGTEEERSSAGEVNGLDFGYCLTAHKAQGCEWNRVFIVIHASHFLANREWLYTAGTRAKQSCMILAKGDTLKKVVYRQRIKGDSLNAKIESFNTKMKSKNIENSHITFDRSQYGVGDNYEG